MSGHTPGPWIAVGAWVEHPDDDVADICSCDPATINQGHLGRGYSEICANARLIAAAPAMRAEIDRLKRERHHIYDLLARIHRDGGQYTAEHGVEKSCDDAEAQVVTWIETIGGADALIEQARIAEREACISAIENEHVHWCDDYDGSYNMAIDHAVSAIRERTNP